MSEENRSVGLGQLLYKPEQAALILAVGRTTVYALMASGALRSVKIGGLRRIPAGALVEYASQLEAEVAA